MKKFVILISICTIALLVLLLAIANPSTVWNNIKSIRVEYILLVISLYLVNLMVKTLRWKVMMMSSGERVKYTTLFPIFVVGMAINNLTPGRIAGDPVRALIISSKKNIGMGKCIAAVFAEKTLDLVFLIILSAIGFVILIPYLTGAFKLQIFTALIIVAFILIFALVLVFNPVITEKLRGRKVACW